MIWKKLLSRRGVDYTTIFKIDEAFFQLLDEFGHARTAFFTHCTERSITHYTTVEAKAWGLQVWKRHFGTRERLLKLYEEGEALLQRAQPRELESALAQFSEEFAIICTTYTTAGWLAIEAWQEEFEKVFDEWLRATDQEEQREKLFAAVTRPWKKTALYRLWERVGKEAPERLAEEFAFLGRDWGAVWREPLTTEWVKRLTPLPVREDSERVTTDNPTLQLAPYVFFFKDWRDDLRRQHAHQWSWLFDELSKRFGVEREALGYLSMEELSEALKQGFPHETVAERRKGFIIHWQDGLQTSPVTQYERIIRAVEHAREGERVRGKGAFPGVVRGTVVLVKSVHDLKKVDEGSVLVANTTHPEYVPAMERAAAIVTAEGGLTSHAAIIAREMKRPCIVGCQNAMRTFKDGDLVEVDAEKGVVRKL